MRIGIHTGAKPVKKSFEQVVNGIVKAAREASEMEKAMGHKYVKREGSPGNYKYWYRLPNGSLGSKADLDAATKGKKLPEQGGKRLGIRKPVREKPAAQGGEKQQEAGKQGTGQKSPDRFGPAPGKENRKRYSEAFVQAQKEFAGRGITHPTGKTPGFRERIQDIYEKSTGGNDSDTNQYAGSVAVGDTITGVDAHTENSITGKVQTKGRDGVTVVDDKNTTHHISWNGIQKVEQVVNDQDAIRMLYDKEAISPGWRNSDSGFQPDECDTIDGLLKAAAGAREDFNAISDEYLKRFAKLDPILIKRPVLKGIDRIKEKLRDDWKNGNKTTYEPGPPEVYHTKTIRDIDGHTFTLKSVADVGRVLAAFEKDKRIVRIKNNFAKPSELGYSDINMNIRLPNGTIAEIQLNTTANLVAKERYGHSLYEIHRSIKSDKQCQDLDNLMIGAQKALYGLSNRDSKSGTYQLSDAVNEAVINGDTGALFKEEHKEYAEALKPFVNKAIPLFKKAVEEGKISNKTVGHFNDLVNRLKNI